MDMQTILQRYHSLALHHHTQTKRRKLEHQHRNALHVERLKQLKTLHTMATDTLEFCTKVLRSEEDYGRREEIMEEPWGDYAGMEEEVRRAGREKVLAEVFLRRLSEKEEDGMNNFNAGVDYHYNPTDRWEGKMNYPNNNSETRENENRWGEESNHDHRIGGIPSKFLDLSHFPKLQQKSLFQKQHQQKQHQGGYGSKKRKKMKHHGAHDADVFSPGQQDFKQMRSPIIDCTEEGGMLQPHHSHNSNSNSNPHPPMRIPSFGNGIPQEIATATTNNSTNTQKQNTKRIYITHASLSHVNGTYIQADDTYNNSPLFVKVGPPRKFMGRWDCSVVLRREKRTVVLNSSDEHVKGVSARKNCLANQGHGGNTAEKLAEEQEYIWKIGLVPAHRITHHNIICYFVHSMAKDDAAIAKKLNVDRMDEDFDVGSGDELSYGNFEPPVDGWRVFQQANSTIDTGTGTMAIGGMTTSTLGSDITNNLGRASSLKVSYE